MNKKQKKWSLVVASVAVAGSSIAPSALANTFATEDSVLFEKLLKEAQTKWNEAKASNDEKALKEAIIKVTELPYIKDYKPTAKNDLLGDMYAHINAYENPDDKINYAEFMIDAQLARTLESLLYVDFEETLELVQSLPDSKKKTNYINQLKTLQDKLDKKISDDAYDQVNGGGGTAHIDFGTIDPSYFDDYIGKDTGDYLPNYPKKPVTSTPKPPAGAEDGNFSENVRYQTEGSACYKVVNQTINGKTSIVSKVKVTGNDVMLCGINTGSNGKDYDFGNVKPAPSGTGSNLQGNSTDGYTPSNGSNNSGSSSGSGSSTDNATKDDKESKNIRTLFFTLDRTEKDTYFYETDLAVTDENTVTYQQQKDILFQLAIQSGGKAVDDKNRFMILLENQLLVIEDTGKPISVSHFDTLLDGFKAQIKVMDTIVGKDKDHN